MLPIHTGALSFGKFYLRWASCTPGCHNLLLCFSSRSTLTFFLKCNAGWFLASWALWSHGQAQPRQSWAELSWAEGELVLCPKQQHFCPSLAAGLGAVSPLLTAVGDKCSHSPHLEAKPNLGFVPKMLQEVARGVNPSQWGVPWPVPMQGFSFCRTV